MLWLVTSVLLVVSFTLGCDVQSTNIQLGQTIQVTSPRFPRNFPGTSKCNYELSSPSATEMELRCETFRLKPPMSIFGLLVCRDNFFSITTTSRTYTFCGNMAQRTFLISGNTFSAEFVSNIRYNYRYRGFKCYLTFSSDSTPSTDSPQSTDNPEPEYTTLDDVTTDGTQYVTTEAEAPGASTSATTTEEKCDCEMDYSDRIVGGTTATQHEYPYQVMLKQNGGHICGGTLIAPDLILTAAHCVYETDPSRLSVSLGDHSKVVNEELSVEIDVARVEVHPDYNTNTFDNDIALLYLETPVTYNEAIKPACLPYSLDMNEVYGQDVVVTGWGTTSFGGSTATVLQELTIPLIDPALCEQYYGASAITDNMICTYKSGYDSCQGDSGGPLVYPKDGKNILVGVVSWGEGCAGYQRPGVYAKVTNYLDWIESLYPNNLCNAS